METRGSLFGKGDLVFTDHPYNVRKKTVKATSKHEVFTGEDIKDFVVLYSEFMALGTCEHISCALLQFYGWYQMQLS